MDVSLIPQSYKTNTLLVFVVLVLVVCISTYYTINIFIRSLLYARIYRKDYYILSSLLLPKSFIADVTIVKERMWRFREIEKIAYTYKSRRWELTTKFVFSYSTNICPIIYLLDKTRHWMGEEGNGSWERDQLHSLFCGHFEKKGSKVTQRTQEC